MHSARPIRFIATLWIVSMVVSWAGGTLVIGFDLGTTLIWLAFLILGPLLVWAYVAATQAQTNGRRLASADGRVRRTRVTLDPITREFDSPPRPAR